MRNNIQMEPNLNKALRGLEYGLKLQGVQLCMLEPRYKYVDLEAMMDDNIANAEIDVNGDKLWY